VRGFHRGSPYPPGGIHCGVAERRFTQNRPDKKRKGYGNADKNLHVGSGQAECGRQGNGKAAQALKNLIANVSSPCSGLSAFATY
jgi:hypothetical protein